MARTIFYSWQSDLPNSTNRGLIRRAIDDAIRDVNATVVEAARDGELSIDQDTQGVPGSPAIVDTILSKIRECAFFVPDVSIVTTDRTLGAGRAHPNPNVLVEYGYALSQKGDRRILPIFNEEFGDIRDLPFDIRHKRVLSYKAVPGNTAEAQLARRKARTELAQRIAGQLRQLLSNETGDDAGAGSFPAARASYGESSFVSPAELLGVDVEDWVAERPTDLQIVDGPHAFLRLIPTEAQPMLSHTDVLDLVRRSQLWPLAPRAVRSASYGRNQLGAFAFAEPRQPTADGLRAITTCIVQLFRTREIWGIDGLSLSRKRDNGFFYVPCTSVEETLKRQVISYLRAAREFLDLKCRVKIVVGFSRVQGFRLAISSHETRGRIMENEIITSSTVQDVQEATETLDRFLAQYWDTAGLRR